MNPETLTALLALWGRCKECKPEYVEPFIDGDTHCFELVRGGRAAVLGMILPDAAASALAADAIERWWIQKQSGNDPRLRTTPLRMPVYWARCTLTGTYFWCWEGDNIIRCKLGQWIAAANAVLDAEGRGT